VVRAAIPGAADRAARGGENFAGALRAGGTWRDFLAETSRTAESARPGRG
jgi:hypothetical protein